MRVEYLKIAVLAAATLLAGASDRASAAASGRFVVSHYYAVPFEGAREEWHRALGGVEYRQVIDVNFPKKWGIEVVTMAWGDGYGEGAAYERQFLKGNKEFYGGHAAFTGPLPITADSNGGIFIPYDNRPVKMWPLRQKLGKTYYARSAQGTIFDGVSQLPIGAFERMEQRTPIWFELLDTPSGYFPSALRVDFQVYHGGGDFFSYAEAYESGTFWLVEGVGFVKWTSTVGLYNNGVFQFEFEKDRWLADSPALRASGSMKSPLSAR